jgi:tRNA(Ile)-lysidine synthase
VQAAGTAELLGRCTFPPATTPVRCALSGGADSTALVALAVAAGCDVTAVHVDHGLRDSSGHDADVARVTAERLGVAFHRIRVDVDEGANLEARAREARRRALGPDALLGHTAEDQAETLLLALLRGSGAAGLAAIGPGWRHPILALRRDETHGLCRELGLEVATDPSNTDPRFRRNRVRHELMPLLDDIAERDVTLLLTRTADLLRSDDQFLEELAASVDPTDAAALAAAPRPVASRAVRQWLDRHGYPPDSAAVARVIAVARGDMAACELSGGRRIERQGGQLVLFPAPATNR